MEIEYKKNGELLSRDGDELMDHEKKVEVSFLEEMENGGVWRIFAKPNKHVRMGTKINFADGTSCEVMVKEKDGSILVQCF